MDINLKSIKWMLEMVDRKVSNWNKIKIKSKSKENKIQSESRSWIEIKLKFYKKLNSKINEIFSREITSLIQNTNRLNLNRMLYSQSTKA